MSTAPTPRFFPVRNPSDVPQPWRTFPFLAADLPRYTDTIAWGDARALALTTVAGDGTSRALVGVGEPEELAPVVAAAFDDGGSALPGSGLESTSVAVASLTRGAWDLVPALVRDRLGLEQVAHWDWLVTTTEPPAQPGEDRVVELDLTTDRAELAGLQRLVLPQSYTTLDRPDTRWFGWRDSGGVLRCMAAATVRAGELHLGSIGTHPQWRRRGLAAMMTAALTRIGLAQAGQVSLGLYADNVAARRVYLRLGYRLGQEVESRRPAR
ncbi:GNAT family N-acetyltransferase [Ruania zhangjianzhongii]|uniref:GNAT family N-acetyltransferase n=1 Tax=Ruania zhangjianzhongii TaxID=2603206 RepID=UPI0011CC54B4|nr:GNAT family N-acetyltransferase [Ruania zhangjianzhongii]